MHICANFNQSRPKTLLLLRCTNAPPCSLTCRRRHVKCDEAKPKCKACSRINKACAWADDVSSQSTPDREENTAVQSRQRSESIAVYESRAPEYSTSLDRQLEAEALGNDLASPGGAPELPAATNPSPERNATDGWAESSPVATRVSNATADGHAATHSTQSQHSSSSTHAENSPGADRATEYILSPSSIQSIPQTLGASPDLHSLGPFPNDWIHVGSGLSQTFNVDDATSAWASLLLRDASSRIDAGGAGGGEAGLDLPGLGLNSASIRPLPPPPPARGSDQGQEGSFVTERPSMQDTGTGTHAAGRMYNHDKPWQSSVSLKLEKHEYLLFHDFVQNLSLWVRHFLQICTNTKKLSSRWTFLTLRGRLAQLFHI